MLKNQATINATTLTHIGISVVPNITWACLINRTM